MKTRNVRQLAAILVAGLAASTSLAQTNPTEQDICAIPSPKREPAQPAVGPSGATMDLVPAPTVGSYMRVCPGGQQIVHSGYDGTILDMTKNPPENIKGPCGKRGEPYPDHDCDFVLYSGSMAGCSFQNPTNSRSVTGMSFLRMRDLLANKSAAKPPMVKNLETNEMEPMVDSQHDSWYQSTGSKPGANKNQKIIRVQVDSRYREYTVNYNDQGDPTEWKKGPITSFCSDPAGGGYVASGGYVSTPIISKDGNLVAFSGRQANGREGTVLARLDGGKCTLVAELPGSLGKVRFDNPAPGKLGRVVYTGPAQSDGGNAVYVYDMDAKTNTLVSPATPAASYTYPGFADDNTIMAGVSTTKDGQSFSGFAKINLKPVPQTAQVKPKVKATAENLRSDPQLSCFDNDAAKYDRALSAFGNVWKTLCKDKVADADKLEGEALQNQVLQLDGRVCQQIWSDEAKRKQVEAQIKGTDLTMTQIWAACTRRGGQ